MKNTGTLQVTTPTEREIVLTRVFDAPRNLVFDGPGLVTHVSYIGDYGGRQRFSDPHAFVDASRAR